MTGRPVKRLSGTRGHDRRTYSLMVHGAEFGAGEELVLNPDCFPDLKVNDLVEISQPEREHHQLVLQVVSLNAVRGKLQVSILKDVAAQFGLDPFYPVMVQKVDVRDVTVDYLELTFKDQFVSRADIWRVKVAMFGKCVFLGKHVATLGVRSQVEALLSSNQNVMCGVVGADTKMIVRSRSSRLIWLVQMSTEMWEFAPDGELYYEKMLNRLLKVLISKWNECSVSHSVTIIVFSRSYYEKNQFPDDYDPNADPFRDPNRQGFGPGCDSVDAAHGYGPTIHVDPVSGRYYEDFYKVVVMNYTGPDWGHLLKILKREFVQYHEKHRWRTPDESVCAEYEICQVRSPEAQDPAPTTEAPILRTCIDAPKARGTYVKWKALPYGEPSRAADGNILEAINVTLNIMDKHFMDRDLNRTGQSIVMLTAGSSVFRVDDHLVQVTKQRMMDNGVGMDMISLATPPLHVVPLFICRANSTSKSPMAGAIGTRTISGGMMRSPSIALFQPSQDRTSTIPCPQAASSRTFYIVPHWVNITFLEFDCQCAAQLLASSQSSTRQTKKLLSHRLFTCECQVQLNKRFTPLPPFRMFDVAAPTEKLAFPIALASMIKGQSTNNANARGQNADEEANAVLTPQLESPRRKLSFPSDTTSTGSQNGGNEQWHLCKSPDFVMHRSPRLESYAATGLSASLMAREALEEYDADVFTPATWKKTECTPKAYDETAFDEDADFASLSLNGDMLSLINNSRASNRWKSASSHAALGSSSIVHSILSPRSLMPQSRSSSSVNRPVPGLSPNVPPMKRDSSTHSLTGFALDAANPEPPSQPKDSIGDVSRSTQSRTSASMRSPPLVPTSQATRGFTFAASDITRSTPVKSVVLGPQLVPSSQEPAPTARLSEDSDATKTPRSVKLHSRSVRSPPLTASSAAMVPSPMGLSGSYKKSFLTGNGMPPGVRRTESDQTSTTPVVGSFYVGSDPSLLSSSWVNRSEVNPFRYSTETVESTAARITSDRRRWSHLFPSVSNSMLVGLSHDDDKQTHLGPNWKSLTSPAILPLTTDYQPSPNELNTNYNQSFYALTLPSTDGGLFPKYKNHDELLIEMICQRLASDFQLVAVEGGADIDMARKCVVVGSANRRPSGELRDTGSNTTVYYLSMGHRIHQIDYDASLQKIEVKRFVDRTSQGEHNEPVVYKYSLWVDRTQSFHPLEQNFYQYPMPEDNWNALDHLLCGYLDDMPDVIKYRRIRFAVLPPSSVIMGTRADKEAYAQRFTKFVDYLQTRVASEHGVQEKIRINVSLDPLPSPNLRQQVGALSYKMSCDAMASYTRLKSEDPRNEWLMMHVEDTMEIEKSYHFDVRWLACSGIIVDDFISTIRRKAKQAGLELRRIPEYTSVSFLQIHPLIAPVFLPMPLKIMRNSNEERALTDALVNRLEFVFDDEKLVDARGIGYGLGIGKEEKSSVDSASRPPGRSKRRVRSKEEIEAQLLEKWRRRGYKQYIHRQAPVFLRLIHNGIVWITSYDYDQISTPAQLDALFKEICGLIQDFAIAQNVAS